MDIKTGHTEDGVFALYNIYKIYSNGEVKITNLDYVPTWVNMQLLSLKKFIK